MTLSALMCLLVVIQLIREALQMYKATKRFQLNGYMNLLVWEGMIYFLTYVDVSSFLFLSFLLFPLSRHYANGELLRTAS